MASRRARPLIGYGSANAMANPIAEAFGESWRSAWQAAPLGDSVAVALGRRGLLLMREGGCS